MNSVQEGKNHRLIINYRYSPNINWIFADTLNVCVLYSPCGWQEILSFEGWKETFLCRRLLNNNKSNEVKQQRRHGAENLPRLMSWAPNNLLPHSPSFITRYLLFLKSSSKFAGWYISCCSTILTPFYVMPKATQIPWFMTTRKGKEERRG